VKIALIVATIGVVVGVADLPYGYYMLLRFALCGISLFLMFGANMELADSERWLLGGCAVLYNPLLPIRLGEKRIWLVLNMTTLALFWTIRRRQART
jgi:uncharacterized protein DUF6804